MAKRKVNMHFDGLVQDCSIFIALAMKILQSCTKPLIYTVEGLKNHMKIYEKIPLELSCLIYA